MSEEDVRDLVGEDAVSTAQAQVAGAYDKAKHTVGACVNKAKEYAHGAQEGAHGAYDKAKEKVRDVYDYYLGAGETVEVELEPPVPRKAKPEGGEH